MLFSSGLIAGESLLGVGLALLAVVQVKGFEPNLPSALKTGLTVAALVFVCWMLVRSALKARKA